MVAKPKQTVQEKAHAYLAEGKIQVGYVDVETREAVLAGLGSAADPYVIKFHHNVWTCTCPAHVLECAHIIGAKIIVPLRSDASGDGRTLAPKDEQLDSMFDVTAPPPQEESSDGIDHVEYMAGDID